MNAVVPTDPKNVTDRDREAAAVVLPEFEQRLVDAHARSLSPKAVQRIQEEYEQARYDSLDDDDADNDDGLDDLKKDELIDLADEHGVDLSGARTNADRVQALRHAGVSA